jgi:hypothetical protein
MSRILRRPMFRGGPINSEGTGITSGLNYQRQRYADGPDDQGVQSNDDFMNDVFMRTIYGDNYDSQGTPNVPVQETVAERIARQRDESNRKISEYNQKLNEGQGATTSIGINPDTGLPFTPRDRLKLAPSIDELAKKEGFDIGSGTAREQIEKRKTFEEYLKNKKNEPANSKSNVLTDVNSLFYKKNPSKEGIDEDAQFDKFYNRAYKALGGEKAGTQAIYDAMLAASPGFFRGRTLTEAAPNVLEGINKSGAFDKPQKLRQAAAELALTRQIGMEKIQEQEKARSALLNQKLTGPQTIQNDIAKIQANIKAGSNPITILGEAPSAIKGVNLSELDKNPEASAYIDKQPKGKIILVEDKQGMQHYILVTSKDKNNKSAWSKVGEKGIGQVSLPLSATDQLAYNNSFRSE